MTTRDEYAEAAKWIQTWQVDCAESGMVPTPYILAIRVLRALADGAVLCNVMYPDPYVSRTGNIVPSVRRYVPLDPQP